MASSRERVRDRLSCAISAQLDRVTGGHSRIVAVHEVGWSTVSPAMICPLPKLTVQAEKIGAIDMRGRCKGPGGALVRGWPLNCDVLPLNIKGASRFLRKWPAATLDIEPPEALWPATKGQAGSLARVRGHPLKVQRGSTTASS